MRGGNEIFLGVVGINPEIITECIYYYNIKLTI